MAEAVHSISISRRALLGMACIAVPATLVADMIPASHPDAALLSAWDRWRSAMAALRTSDGLTPLEAAALERLVDEDLHAVLTNSPASTLDGLLVQARYLLWGWSQDDCAEDYLVTGNPTILPSRLSDSRWRLHTNVLDSIERLRGAA